MDIHGSLKGNIQIALGDLENEFRMLLGDNPIQMIDPPAPVA
jgi:hypothetical protein